MTDWGKLGAGRKLDAEIASRLGHKVRFEHDEFVLKDQNGGTMRCPEYSRYVVQAWLLLDGTSYKIRTSKDGEVHVTLDNEFTGRAESVPLAICRAFLTRIEVGG